MLAPRLLAVPALVLALGVSGCGSDDSDTTTSTAASAPDAPVKTTAAIATVEDHAITIRADEYSFAPTAMRAPAGKLKITTQNVGKIEHELVLLRTTTNADGLKVDGGRVSEDDSVGEVSETEGGASKSHTFTLKPGTYVYICNIPGHYMDGMRGTLTVQ
jgi:uncharacterized cupredoxin-like copper-binding protein